MDKITKNRNERIKELKNIITSFLTSPTLGIVNDFFVFPWLLFRKEKETEIEPGISAEINVIPDAFYGGKDPMIHYGSAREQKQGVGLQLKEKNVESSVLSRFFANKKLFYATIGLVFTAIVGLISWYYISQATKQVSGGTKEDLPQAEQVVANRKKRRSQFWGQLQQNK